MGKLKITSETGMFHSACEVTIRSSVNWYGFQPKAARTPVSDGKVDTSDRSALINHYVSFDITDTVLENAVRDTVAEYTGKDYILGVIDCVSFSADMARKCGLVMPKINMTPYGFIQILKFYNDYTESG